MLIEIYVKNFFNIFINIKYVHFVINGNYSTNLLQSTVYSLLTALVRCCLLWVDKDVKAICLTVKIILFVTLLNLKKSSMRLFSFNEL